MGDASVTPSPIMNGSRDMNTRVECPTCKASEDFLKLIHNAPPDKELILKLAKEQGSTFLREQPLETMSGKLSWNLHFRLADGRYGFVNIRSPGCTWFKAAASNYT